MQKFFSLFLILFSISLFSQQTGGNINNQFQNMVFNVSGLVSDSDTDEPLEYATISIKNKRTPDKVFGGLTGICNLVASYVYVHLVIEKI